ncbi:DUF58 domain-containing protein [Ruminococcaceae bacterium OttesenSCG-928-L11]|nr:DUF58 domain-containing protein [Ruminococcaceae bacterium OttesenSCG-928-L11]
MKSLKLIWYTAMAALLVAGRITGRRELFLLLFFMGFVVLYSLALNAWTILSFSYVQEVSEPATVKGSAARLRLAIYNDKPFPFTLMQLRVETVSAAQPALLSFNLSPNSRISFDIPLHCVYRGVYPVGMTRLEVNDLFGLLRLSFDMRALSYYRQREIRIYPQLPSGGALRAQNTDSKFQGGGLHRLSEEGEAFSDLRRYRPGDPLKRVHRTASVRRRELYVKIYDIPMETSALIVLDNAIGMDGENALHLADVACECAAAVAHYSLRAGFTVALASSETTRQTVLCRSPREFPRLYDELAAAPFFDSQGRNVMFRDRFSHPSPLRGRCDLPAVLTAEARSRQNLKAVTVISTAASPAIRDAISGLLREGCTVKYILPTLSGSAKRPDLLPAAVEVIPVAVGDNCALVLSQMH